MSARQPSSPNRLHLSTDALTGNWRALAAMSGRAACGAAVKADGYGLGAREVATRLIAAGCRDLFVATWAEAAAVAGLGARVSVLHGVRGDDLPLVGAADVRPVLNTPAQVARWREAGAGRACDVMVDTGMNRLGVAPQDVAAGLLGGLAVDTIMSHLACADEPDSAMNARQCASFAALAGVIAAGRAGAARMSLANSAGIALGADYAFDLTRPGLAVYGGVPVPALAATLRPVVTIEAEVLQRRLVPAGETVGYNATWRASRDTAVAIVNLGYADGYGRGFSDRGRAFAGDATLPVIGRVSMDLIALDVSEAEVGEGDWVAFDPDLPRASVASGTSQYELLTGLGARFARVWG